MPSVKQNAADKANDLSDQVVGMFPNLQTTQQPVVICGVQRKINIGNFENIDVYCAVAMPLDISHCVDNDQVTEMIDVKLDELLHITSKKTSEKYNLVKNSKS
jgi:hypothetical protein